MSARERTLQMIFGVAILACVAPAQNWTRSRSGNLYTGGEESYVPEDAHTPRDCSQHSFDQNGKILETPNWTNTPGFEPDVFTFARIKRDWKPVAGSRWEVRGSWKTDTPDSDLNLSWRLQQVTSIKVDPNGRYLRLTDPDLANYPFIYMVEPGTLSLRDDEVVALRKYLLNGGFLWLDDFWGDREWNAMAEELKKVFPDRDWVELPLNHPLYHCVFDINSKGQVPNYWTGEQSKNNGGITWESNHEGDVRTVHHKAIFDDKGRIMVFATHNTDNGDGWEREGTYKYFFEHFSEKISYPLAVNVVYYVMTH